MNFNGVTFVIPAYNESKNIYTCVTSIHEEMHQYRKQYPYEIIVVDNNSTDNTAEIAEKAGAWVDREERKGVVFARQHGFELADYDLVAFIDADSFLPVGWFWEAIRGFDKKDVVCVSGPLYFYDAGKWLNYGTSVFYVLAKIFHHIWPTVQGGNFILKKSALQSVGGFDINLTEFWGEDTRTAVLLNQVGSIFLNRRMKINTSARRLHEQGLLNTTWTYVVNYLSVNIFGKATKKGYNDYR